MAQSIAKNKDLRILKEKRSVTLSRFGFLTLLLLLGGACDEADFPASRTVFWRVEYGNRVSWLFGTIHLGHPRFQPLPDELKRALAESDLFIAEMDLSTDTQMELLRAMQLPEGKSLRELLGEPRFLRLQKTLDSLGLKLTPQYLDRQEIWAASLLVARPQHFRDNVVLDLLLHETAKLNGCRTLGIENPAEHAAVLDSLSTEEQIFLMDDALAESEAGFPELNTLISAYLGQDTEQLHDILRAGGEMPISDEPGFRESFIKQLITERNHRFVERLLPMMREQACFIAVGAGHLPGDEGLLALLLEAGCELTPVPFKFAPGTTTLLPMPTLPSIVR